MNISRNYQPSFRPLRFSGNTETGVRRTSGPANTLISEAVFIFLDCEYTTIEDPHEARLIEVSAIRVQGNRIIGSYKTLVNPGVPIPSHITEKTDITDDMVQREGIPEREALQKLCEFMGENPTIVGDFPGIESVLLPYRLSAFGMEALQDRFALEKTLCTRKLAEQSILNGHNSFRFHLVPTSRNTDAYSIGIRMRLRLLEPHRAKNDTHNTQLVFYELVKMLSARGILTVGDLRNYQGISAAIAY
jgi:DNA polymerase III alpha subunit (gram-positive type)